MSRCFNNCSCNRSPRCGYNNCYNNCNNRGFNGYGCGGGFGGCGISPLLLLLFLNGGFWF
ncbi:hypothetical protein [Clostridium sp. Ade.TY]|uniref:hypothetical protein n=1 Tax=Clostridium sp. Ade.TY TaxID=1391647 RepID=UPI000406CEDE|nr:hypothetical protein [Clostridium sp. Ade.TY]